MTDEELLATFPNVRIDHDNAPYYRGLAERRLLVNRCEDCGRYHHPPRPRCPRCWSSSVVPTEVRGTGSVAMVTILRQGRPEPGVDYATGHPVVAIELDEQRALRISGTVVGVPATAIRLGDRVRAVWRDVPGREPRADFEIVGGTAS